MTRHPGHELLDAVIAERFPHHLDVVHEVARARRPEPEPLTPAEFSRRANAGDTDLDRARRRRLLAELPDGEVPGRHTARFVRRGLIYKAVGGFDAAAKTA
jgi:hypothetical protein